LRGDGGGEPSRSRIATIYGRGRSIVFKILNHSQKVSTARYVTVAGGAYGAGNIENIPWVDNQWYRLRIKDDPVSGVIVSMVTDDGSQTLASAYLGVSLSALGESFYVGVSRFRYQVCGSDLT